LQPQQTGAMFSQPTGMNNFGQGPPPPVPPMPQQAPAPLLPQKTGPPPPVRFGVKPDAKKLAPQPTGKRANLAAASELPLLAQSFRTCLLTPLQLPTIPLVFSQLQPWMCIYFRLASFSYYIVYTTYTYGSIAIGGLLCTAKHRVRCFVFFAGYLSRDGGVL
jgi:hypothetical protein